jgi:hypothetical protein
MPNGSSKSPTQGLVIALSILMAVGFVVLYFKQDLDTNLLSSQVGMLAQQVASAKHVIATHSNPAPQSVVPPVASTQNSPADPISFSTSGLDVHVAKTWTNWAPPDLTVELTLQNLKGMVSECGNVLKADSYYNSLAESLSGSQSVEYDITSNQASQDPTYKVYAVANNAGYKNLAAAKADLDVCAAGGLYPVAVDAKWIVFEGSCGGASNSNLPPPMCGTIQESVSPTIKLVQ